MYLYENDLVYIVRHEHELPWVKVFARDESLVEFSDCDERLRGEIMRCVLGCERALREFYAPTKINIASFGNELARVHWHIIARFTDDAYYPRSVWAQPLRASSTNLCSFDDFIPTLRKHLA